MSAPVCDLIRSAVRCGMVPRALAAKFSVPGFAFDKRDEFGERVDAQRRRNRDHHRLLGDEADRREIAEHVDLQAGEHLRHDDVSRRRREIERVAIGRRLDRLLGGDAAAGTGGVQNDDLLLPAFAEFVGDDARDHIGAARRRALSNELDGSGRIILRLHRRSQSARKARRLHEGSYDPGQSFAPPAIVSTPRPSSPRKRESITTSERMGPRFRGDDRIAISPTPLPPPRRSSAASPIARPRPARCLPRSRRSRIAATGRADRAARTSPLPRSAS